jgi:putative DNA primase/helicase
MAAALTGQVIPSVAGWYPKRDCTRIQRVGDHLVPIPGEAFAHPDKIAELIRWRICEGEIEQAIGRCRGVARKAVSDPGRYNGPVDVYILNDCALSIPIDTFTHFTEMAGQTPIDAMLAAGGIAFKSGASASAAYPEIWAKEDAATKALRRSTLSGEVPDKPHIDINMGNVRHLVFQRLGIGQKPQEAIIDLRWHPDPRAAIEAKLGPLAKLELVEPPEIAEPISIPAPIEIPIAEMAVAQSFAGAIVLGLAAIEAGDGTSPIQVEEPDWPALRDRLRDSGIPHGDLATKWCGISQSHLSNMERGFRKVTPEVAAALAQFLVETQPTQTRLL